MSDREFKITPRLVLQMALILLVLPLLPIFISVQWSWWEAWTFAAVYIFGFAASRRLAARRHPDLIAERARSMGFADAKAWDKVLAPLLSLGLGLVLVVAGLDARLGWTPLPFPLWAKLAALGLILIGYAFSSWALIENRFFSGVVRIQTDRGHHVVSTGPYRWIRHPGYAGALLTYLVTPVLLGSLWAFAPAILLVAVLVVRTALEDKTLQAELPGYAAYAQRTRYRLVPGIW
ncbi:MAG: isoprenylcysteine carboxylmethyltransferase family protein [Chloroflexota bacterium]